MSSTIAEVQPTPEQVGFIIANAIAKMPLPHPAPSPNPELSRLFDSAQITEQDLLNERFLLSFCAAEHAISEALARSDTLHAVKAGLRSYLMQSKNPAAIFAAENLDESVSYYAEAAAVDAEKGELPVGEMAELDLAFGDQLMNLGDDNAARARACIELAMFAPSALWNTHSNSARQVLIDAKLLSAH